MEKVVYILRGLPGCGKSDLAQKLGRAICCADDFFIRKGEYKWFREGLGAAHDWCRRKFIRFMKKGVSPIILSNTATTEKEFKPYMEMAEAMGYKVYSLVVENRHGNSNVHNVGSETLEKMKTRFDVKLC